MSIKNVVFDVGEVLVEFRYMNYMRDLGFDEEVVDFLAENMVLSEFWHELDLGIRTNSEGKKVFTEKYPQYASEIDKFWDHLEDIVREYDYAPGLIREIKQMGYKVYILSNYPIEIAEMHWPKFRFLPLTDGHIISAYEKLTKPDAAIYRLLESRFGLDLTECLFIDDRQINIDGAASLGMETLLFKGYDESYDEIMKILK